MVLPFEGTGVQLHPLRTLTFCTKIAFTPGFLFVAKMGTACCALAVVATPAANASKAQHAAFLKSRAFEYMVV